MNREEFLNKIEGIKEFLYAFYENNKNNIYNIHIGGSFCYNFLDNFGDIDIIVLVKNLNSINIFEYNSLENFLKTNFNADLILRVYNFDLDIYNDIYKYLPMYYYDRFILFGEDIKNNINILDNKEVLFTYLYKIANKNIERIFAQYRNIPKNYYHYFILLFILKNNNYNFNQEQIKIINRVHNKLGSIKEYCIFKTCFKELAKEFTNELL